MKFDMKMFLFLYLRIKTVLLFLTILTVSSTFDCKLSFKSYLDCMSWSIGDKGFEREFDDEFTKHVADCFDDSYINGQNKKCILSKANLDTDVFGADGPLKFCEKCQQYAVEIRDHLFSADESRSCFRKKLTAAIVNDLQPCIRNEYNDQNFIVPEFPDFDKNTKDFMELVLKSVSHRVMAYSRLGACKLRYPSRAQATNSCMSNTNGLYPKQCDLSKTCKSSSVMPDCQETFTKIITATCKCVNTKRDELHQRLDRIHDAIFNSEHSSTICSSVVKAAYGHWVQDIEDIFKNCSSSADGHKILPNIPITKLIDAGCIQAEEYASDNAKLTELNTGFRFVRFVLDALDDRMTRFCSTIMC